MLRKTAFIAAIVGFALAGPALAESTEREPKEITWGFEGPFGKFNQEQLQRGYKVYHEVCSSCHSMGLLSYRDLGANGGPFASEEFGNPNENPYVKAIAAEIEVPDIDSETGDPITRKATPADKFKAPFPNEAASRASNGGAYPPDLSVITKAREGGAPYVYSLLTGFAAPPAGLVVPPGKHYNPYFPGDLGGSWKGDKNHVPVGGLISMAPPLQPDLVTFDDGTKSTVAQQARDVAAFLSWASEPKQTERKQTGFAVIIYLLILAGLLYASYRRIWRNVAH